MLSQFGSIIASKHLLPKITNFTTGIEVEMDSVNEDGTLSTQPYPRTLGNQATNPWITNDYLEAMSEVVTPPAQNTLDAMQYLYGINGTLRRALGPHQYLWPLSMPLILPKHKTKAILAKAGPIKEKYLSDIYDLRGPASATQCGIHLNISIKSPFIDILYQNAQKEFACKPQLMNHLYLKIGQGFMRYRWLLTYLFGASPLAEANYFETPHRPEHPVRSLRQSATYGFIDPVTGDYTSVKNYAQRILDAVNAHKLLKPSEFHGAIRLKGDPDLHQLPRQGVQYIELRMLDLAPDSPIGIKNETLQFFKLLITYFIMAPGMPADQITSRMADADQKNEQVTLEYPLKHCTYEAEARQFLNQLRQFAAQFELAPDLKESLFEMQFRLNHPEATPSGKLLKHVKNNFLLTFGMQRAKAYQSYALQAKSKYQGFQAQHGLVSATELKHNLLRGYWNFI